MLTAFLRGSIGSNKLVAGHIRTLIVSRITDEFISGQRVIKQPGQQVLRENMCELGSTLRMIIEQDNGFLDNLFKTNEVLTKEHFDEMQATLYNKNDKLLDFLIHRYTGDYIGVLEALVETGQEHVANFICSNGSKFRIPFEYI
jgi:hypothetical protein